MTNMGDIIIEVKIGFLFIGSIVIALVSSFNFEG
jgi:hypothetical protein